MKERIGEEAAAERLATRFTRPMRAAISPYGVLTDPPVICALIAVVVVISVILYNLDVINEPQLPIVYAAIAAPVLLGVGVNIALGRAHPRLVRWLAELPFPVDNMNALLNGVGQSLVVRFEDAPPTREELNASLEQVHEDCFALELDESQREVEVAIGVPDSKMNPAGASHRRYRRVVQLVEQSLLPLAEQHPIESIRIN